MDPTAFGHATFVAAFEQLTPQRKRNFSKNLRNVYESTGRLLVDESINANDTQSTGEQVLESCRFDFV